MAESCQGHLSFSFSEVECLGSSTSVLSGRRDSLSRLFPCVFNIDARTARAEQICLSQTQFMWLANGGFLLHFIQSPPIPSMKDWILWSFISEYAFFSSLSSPLRLLLLSVRLILHLHVWQQVFLMQE